MAPAEPPDNLVVLGAGGHAKVVVSTLLACGSAVAAVFDDDTTKWGQKIQGVVVGRMEPDRVGRAVIAIGDNAQRREFARGAQFQWETVIHPSASVHPSAKIGCGTVIFAGAIVQPDVVIGDHVIVNTGATIDHDCVIGDYAHLAPGVHLAGMVQVGEGALLGIGCVALPGVKIGAWSTLGAGAVLLHHLADGVRAAGVPAQLLEPKKAALREPEGSIPAPGKLKILGTADREAWLQALRRSCRHDVYHLPGYHALAERRGEGTARLFTYVEGGYSIALPLLIRPLHGITGLAMEGWNDATSVYGYPGPVFSHPAMPAAVLQRFHTALQQRLLSMSVVSIFSRLHPLLAQEPIVGGIGKTVVHGQTIPIDLTPPLETVRAHYRRNHRRDLKALAKLGVTCVRDESLQHLDAFIAIYREAMRRLDAAPIYDFDRSYFEALLEAWRGAVQLFVCLLDGQPICAGLFTEFEGISQAHLAGTLDEYTGLAPMKMLYDEAVAWAKGRGCHVLHMGGGIGSRRDSLFNFKTGFSPLTADFRTWHWVLAPDAYRTACMQRAQWQARHGLQDAADHYFPAYRAPSIPAGSAPRAPVAAETGEPA